MPPGNRTLGLMTSDQQRRVTSERHAHAEPTYERRFGPRDADAPDDDPELGEILRRFIFGDVFDTGCSTTAPASSSR